MGDMYDEAPEGGAHITHWSARVKSNAVTSISAHHRVLCCIFDVWAL